LAQLAGDWWRALMEERNLLDGREWVGWVADGNHLLIKVIN
jgi:hypothetical protein